MERAIPFVVALTATLAFQLGFRLARPSRVWPIALGAIVVGTVVAIWFDQRAFNPRSPYAFAPMFVIPALISCAIAHAGSRGRWAWPLTTVVGAVAAFAAIIPMWFVSCVLAQSVSGAGCRF